jgi:hypothetical protein
VPLAAPAEVGSPHGGGKVCGRSGKSHLGGLECGGTDPTRSVPSAPPRSK